MPEAKPADGDDGCISDGGDDDDTSGGGGGGGGPLRWRLVRKICPDARMAYVGRWRPTTDGSTGCGGGDSGGGGGGGGLATEVDCVVKFVRDHEYHLCVALQKRSAPYLARVYHAQALSEREFDMALAAFDQNEKCLYGARGRIRGTSTTATWWCSNVSGSLCPMTPIATARIARARG
jgi:hypothetical protein